MSFRPKTIAITGYMCLLATAASAQVVDPAAPVPPATTQTDARDVRPVGFGLKAGLNYSNLSLDPDIDLPIKATWGGVGGLFVVGEVTPAIALQIEALYSQRGVQDDVEEADATARLTYIDIPVTARWSSAPMGETRFHLFTGPQVGIKVKAEVINDQLDMTSSISDQIKNWDLGWTAGAGISMNRVSLDARYTFGLTDISAAEDDTGSAKNRTFTVLLGVQFR